MFGQDRDQMRRFYCDVWRKMDTGQPLEPLEQQLATVIEQHPEYHALLQDTELACSTDYLPETGESNPFLHMGLHMAIQEQRATDRPAGIRRLYQQLLDNYPAPHDLEHRIMECLTEMIWRAQRDNAIPDEQAYLKCIRELFHTGSVIKPDSL